MTSDLFTEQDERDLLVLARAAFPHDGLDDAPYIRTVDALVERCTRTPLLLHAVADGLVELRDTLGGEALAGQPADTLLAALEARQEEEFFVAFRSAIAWTLYDDREVWAHIGYPGASFESGGYVNRGFNDLAWLPEPRIEESDQPLPEIGPLARPLRTVQVAADDADNATEQPPVGTFDAFTGPDDARATDVSAIAQGVQS